MKKFSDQKFAPWANLPGLFRALGLGLASAVLCPGSVPAHAAPLQFESQSALNSASDPIRIQTFKTHSRLIFSMDEGIQTEWKNSPQGFELFLKGATLTDLGAPLGSEDAWKARFKKIEDSRVSSLDFQESSSGVRIHAKWKFPTGEASLANPAMEVFEYRDKAPAQYVVDFWVKKGPTVAEVRAAKKKHDYLESVRREEMSARHRAERRLATAKAKAEFEDTSRFCREPLNEQKDVFLSFLPVHEPFDFSKWFPTTTADRDFPYYIPQSQAKDAQYVRLALELYRQGKTALVIRTLDFFDSEHPESEYRTEMMFLRANAMLKLGLVEGAERILAKLIAEFKAAPEAVHAGMYLAGRQLEKKAFLPAYETAQWLIINNPTHRLAPIFHMAAAESLYSLKQTERASKEYQWVIENSKEPRFRAQAALRSGDLYAERFQSEQALADYSRALRIFGKEAADFPAVHLNHAEALYALGDYEAAGKAFEAFLDKHPSYPAGWRATFRLGEIAGRKPGEKAQMASHQWFYETINRYPLSAGATLARARIIPCGDHGGFALDTSERFFSEEAQKFEASNEVVLVRFPDFRTLAHIRSLISFGREDKAMVLAVEELNARPHSSIRVALSNVLESLFRKTILGLLADNRKFEAVNFYEDRAKLILRDKPTIEPDYLLKLSQAAADLGLAKLAGEISKKYVALTSIEGRAPAAENSGDLDLKLRDAEAHFTEAKALWVADYKSNEEKIRSDLEHVIEESPFSYWREIMLGMMDERAEKLPSALAHAVKAQLLNPYPESEPVLRVDAWVASLESRAGAPDVALKRFRELEARSRSLVTQKPSAGTASPSDAASVLGLPSMPGINAIVSAEAEILEKQNRWGDAASAYSRIIADSIGTDGKPVEPRNQVMYGYARALLKAGEAQKAQAALKKLTESKTNDFWKKLAGETLANMKTKFGDAKEGEQ